MSAADRAYAEALEQGLPATVSDPVALQRAATLLAATTAGDGGRDG